MIENVGAWGHGSMGAYDRGNVGAREHGHATQPHYIFTRPIFPSFTFFFTRS